MILLTADITNSTMDIILDIASLITGLSAIAAIIISIFSIKKNTKTIKAQNLIELRNLFTEKHRVEIHAALRVQGKINNWLAVDDYLGTFELCYVLINDGNIDLSSFKSQYGYRLGNILFHDEIIYHKLLLEYEFWGNFYKLIDLIYPKIYITNLKVFAKKIRNTYNWSEFVDVGPNAFVMELNKSDREKIKSILDKLRENLRNNHLII